MAKPTLPLQVEDSISFHLQEIQRFFKNSKVTLVARAIGFPNGERDLVMGDDDLDEADRCHPHSAAVDPESRVMPDPLYFAECSYGRLGNEFQATDRDRNSRAEIVRQIRSGEIEPVKILEIDEDAGSCRDVTDELVAEAEAQRHPPTPDEFSDRLRGMLIDHDRDLKSIAEIKP